TLPVPIRAPGPMPPLQPDPELDPELGDALRRLEREVLGREELPRWLGDPNDFSEHDRWTERQSDSGDFYLLLIYREPLHLVGPFPDHRHACSWGVDYEARSDDEGWVVVWLDDAGAVPQLVPP